MFVKSYIANEMPEAMERIRKELGPDAMILSNRQIRGKGLKGFFGKKLVEVTVAYEPVPGKTMIPERKVYEQPRPAPVSTPPAPPAQKRPAAAPASTVAATFSGAQTEPKKFQIAEASIKPAPGGDQKLVHDRRSGVKLSPGAEAIGNRLMEREVFVGVAKKIAAQTQEITAKFNDDPGQVAYSLV